MLPARHRLTHTPVYIAAADTAWDHERINREIGLAKLRSDGVASMLRSLAQTIEDDDAGEQPPEMRQVIEAAVRWCLGLSELDIARPVEAQLLECASMIDASPCASRDDHPVWRYWLGETRKDLRLAQSWLLPDVLPVKFTLRLLSRAQVIEVNALASSERDGAQDLAALRAVRYGLVMIEGPGAPKLKAWERGKAPELAERDLDMIEDAYGLAALLELGYAIRGVARELLESEKKA